MNIIKIQQIVNDKLLVLHFIFVLFFIFIFILRNEITKKPLRIWGMGLHDLLYIMGFNWLAKFAYLLLHNLFNDKIIFK